MEEMADSTLLEDCLVEANGVTRMMEVMDMGRRMWMI